MAQESNYVRSDAGLDARRSEDWFKQVNETADTLKEIRDSLDTFTKATVGSQDKSMFSQISNKLYGVKQSKSTSNAEVKQIADQFGILGETVGKKLSESISNIMGSKLDSILDKVDKELLPKLTAEGKWSVGTEIFTDKQVTKLLEKLTSKGGGISGVKNLAKEGLSLKNIKEYATTYTSSTFSSKELMNQLRRKETTRLLEEEKLFEEHDSLKGKKSRKGKTDEAERQATIAKKQRKEEVARDEESLDVLSELNKTITMAFSPTGIIAGLGAQFAKGNYNLFTGLSNMITGSLGNIVMSTLKHLAPGLLSVLSGLAPLLASVGAVVGTAAVAFLAGQKIGNKIVEYWEKRDAKELALKRADTEYINKAYKLNELTEKFEAAEGEAKIPAARELEANIMKARLVDRLLKSKGLTGEKFKTEHEKYMSSGGTGLGVLKELTSKRVKGYISRDTHAFGAQPELRFEGGEIKLRKYDKESKKVSYATITPGTQEYNESIAALRKQHKMDAANTLTDIAVDYNMLELRKRRVRRLSENIEAERQAKEAREILERSTSSPNMKTNYVEKDILNTTQLAEPFAYLSKDQKIEWANMIGQSVGSNVQIPIIAPRPQYYGPTQAVDAMGMSN